MHACMQAPPQACLQQLAPATQSIAGTDEKWLETGQELVLNWFGGGLEVVCKWFESGLGVILEWVGVVWEWFGSDL